MTHSRQDCVTADPESLQGANDCFNHDKTAVRAAVFLSIFILYRYFYRSRQNFIKGNSIMSKKTINILGILSFAVLVLIDQITKHLAVLRLKGNGPFVLIPDVFELHYLENQGAAFGILQGMRWFFLIITAAIVVLIAYIYVKMPASKRFRFLRVLLVFIAAGAVGNVIDRIRQGYVVDFFYFCLIDFPIFNVADIYVTCAGILLVFAILFYYKDDDLKELGQAVKGSRGKRREK